MGSSIGHEEKMKTNWPEGAKDFLPGVSISTTAIAYVCNTYRGARPTRAFGVFTAFTEARHGFRRIQVVAFSYLNPRTLKYVVRVKRKP